MKYDIIIFGLSKYREWRHERTRNRSYYVMQEMLAREDVNKIVYVDYLPIKRLDALRDYLRLIPRFLRKPFRATPFSVCHEVRPDRLYTYATVASVIDWRLVYRDLKTVLTDLHFQNTIIWSYDPLNVDFFEHLNDTCTVFDIDSDWRTKRNLQQGKSIDYVDVLRKNYNRMASHADFIFTASDDLLEIFMGHDRSYWIADVVHPRPSETDWRALVNEMFTIIKHKKHE